MMRSSLARIKALPEDTRLYCAHEYTTANMQFALTADPDNAELQAQAEACTQLRTASEPTVPSTLAVELASNPFLRWDDPAIVNNLAKHNRLAGSGADEILNR